MTSITHLPDLCLTEIFSNHSLNQQFINASVCTTWNCIQLKLFRTRKSLTLLIGRKEAASQAIEEFAFNSHHHQGGINADGSQLPMPRSKVFVSGDLVHCKFKPYYDHFNVTSFAALFPNVVHLRVGIDFSFSHVLKKLCTLLQACASKLVTLELYYPRCLESPNAALGRVLEDEVFNTHLNNLFHAINNQLVKLRSFTIYCELHLLTEFNLRRRPFDLSFIGRLEELCLATGDDEDIVDMIAKYDHPKLATIALKSELNQHSKLLSKLPNTGFCKKITQLNFGNVTEHSLASMETLARRLTSLTTIQMGISEPAILAKLSTAWAPLSQLTIVQITLCEEASIDHDVAEEVAWQGPWTQLPTVKELSLIINGGNHNILQRFAFHRVFPQLHCLTIHYHRFCDICFPNASLDSDCIRNLVRPLLIHLSHLRVGKLFAKEDHLDLCELQKELIQA